MDDLFTESAEELMDDFPRRSDQGSTNVSAVQEQPQFGVRNIFEMSVAAQENGDTDQPGFRNDERVVDSSRTLVSVAMSSGSRRLVFSIDELQPARHQPLPLLVAESVRLGAFFFGDGRSPRFLFSGRFFHTSTVCIRTGSQ